MRQELLAGLLTQHSCKTPPSVESNVTMASATKRTSTYTAVSDHDRPRSADTKKDMWSSMLDSVASGKKLPEKNILVLGWPMCIKHQLHLLT